MPENTAVKDVTNEELIEAELMDENDELFFVSLEDVLGKDPKILTQTKEGVIKAERLGGKIPITSLTPDEHAQIKKDCTYMDKLPNKRYAPQIDDDKLMIRVIIAAVHKDQRSNFSFKDKSLLKKLGVQTADQAVKELLFPGEITAAAMVVQDISGFDDEAEDLSKKAKN
ncbi:hypothetical protein M3221_13535 [Domibacillus indicus]|uniref:phage tail assembly chaperone n=1 Tax=Domibacillus indicus TaxID=1437523 RepID=UPI0020425280|nr:hypothetical protein [Domibacillus indicus]MCM3789422.1 hypothetical protein [Domibacillus indicus]